MRGSGALREPVVDTIVLTGPTIPLMRTNWGCSARSPAKRRPTEGRRGRTHLGAISTEERRKLVYERISTCGDRFGTRRHPRSLGVVSGLGRWIANPAFADSGEQPNRPDA